MIERESLATYLTGIAFRSTCAPSDGWVEKARARIQKALAMACRSRSSASSRVSTTLVVSGTRPAQGFGHDSPAERAWQALYGHTAYNGSPWHVRSIDVGFVRDSGGLVSAGNVAEFFQLVEKAEGQLYWLDLDRLLSQPPRPLDTERACASRDS